MNDDKISIKLDIVNKMILKDPIWFKIEEIHTLGENNIIRGELEEAKEKFNEELNLLESISIVCNEDKLFVEGMKLRLRAYLEIIRILKIKNNNDPKKVHNNFNKSIDRFKGLVTYNIFEYVYEAASILDKDARVVREISWKNEIGENYDKSFFFGELAYELYENAYNFYTAASKSINPVSEKSSLKTILFEQASEVSCAQGRLADSLYWISAMLKDEKQIEKFWNYEIKSYERGITTLNNAISLSQNEKERYGNLLVRLAIIYLTLSRNFSAKNQNNKAISFINDEKNCWEKAKSIFKNNQCQIACPHHQSNRLVACSANFVSLGSHAPHGKVQLSVLIL